MDDKIHKVVLPIIGLVISAIGVMLGNLLLFLLGDAMLLYAYSDWNYLIDMVWFTMFTFTFAIGVVWLMLSDSGFALLMCKNYQICLPSSVHTETNNGILVAIILAAVLTWIVGYISVNRVYTEKNMSWIRVGRYLSPFFIGLIIEGIGRFNLAIHIVRSNTTSTNS